MLSERRPNGAPRGCPVAGATITLPDFGANAHRVNARGQ